MDYCLEQRQLGGRAFVSEGVGEKIGSVGYRGSPRRSLHRGLRRRIHRGAESRRNGINERGSRLRFFTRDRSVAHTSAPSTRRERLPEGLRSRRTYCPDRAATLHNSLGGCMIVRRLRVGVWHHRAHCADMSMLAIRVMGTMSASPRTYLHA